MINFVAIVSIVAFAAVKAADIGGPTNAEINPSSKVEKYRQKFEHFDLNQDGKITLDEYNTDTEINLEVFNMSFDLNGDGTIDIHEFAAQLGEIEDKNQEEKDSLVVNSIFNNIDADNDGIVSLDELTKWHRSSNHLTEEEKCVPDEDIHEGFGEMDIDGDGKIDHTEWSLFMDELWPKWR